MFGVLISAVDPVATLAIFKKVFRLERRERNPLVYNLVSGESLFNDAVCLALFDALIPYVSEPLTTHAFFGMIGLFIYALFVSALIGVLTGTLGTRMPAYVLFVSSHVLCCRPMCVCSLMNHLPS